MNIRIIEDNIDKSAVLKINNLLESLESLQADIQASEKSPSANPSQVVFTKSAKSIGAQDYFIIVFNDGDQIDKSTLDNEMCLGIYFADRSNEENYINIKNAFDGLRALELQKQLLFKMNSVMEGLVGQVENIKEMHRNMAPFRSEKIRGVGITSRFCAGTSNGGEFFDFFKVGGEVWVISLHATSYMAIGTFLTMIEMWKLESSLTMAQILSDLDSKKDDFEEYGQASILIAKITLSDLSLEAVNIGHHEILAKNDSLIHGNDQHYPDDYETVVVKEKLTKGEGVLLLSPGFFKNNDGEIDGEDYLSFINKNWSSPVEFISELTFQSKKRYNKNDFLPNDQTILMIEVDKNAISKI